MTLTRVGDCHGPRGFHLPDFVRTKLRPHAINEPLGMGNNKSKVPIKDLPCKTMENRKQFIWVGKAMPDPTVDPDITINLRN